MSSQLIPGLIAALLLGGVQVATAHHVVTKPERSAQFPGIYVACDSERKARVEARKRGVNQLHGNGPNYIQNKTDGCIVVTIAVSSTPQCVGGEPSYDGILVNIRSVVQGGWRFFMLDPGGPICARVRSWDFGTQDSKRDRRSRVPEICRKKLANLSSAERNARNTVCSPPRN